MANPIPGDQWLTTVIFLAVFALCLVAIIFGVVGSTLASDDPLRMPGTKPRTLAGRLANIEHTEGSCSNSVTDAESPPRGSERTEARKDA